VNLAVYKNNIKELHRTLGIPDSYTTDYVLPLYIEEQDLIVIGNDIYDRPQLLFSKVADKWHEMRESAKKEEIDLYIVSAFRSVEYQASIIRIKLEKGLKLSDILRVSAAPGYSEHHTGCALDLTTTDVDALSESFDKTKAFEWLQQNGKHYGFKLSYPKNLNSKIIYEPWHWACLYTVT